MIIDSELVSELAGLKEALDRDKCALALKRSARVRRMLEREALDHSVAMEFFVNDRLKNGHRRKAQKELRRVKSYLQKAWRYGQEGFSEGTLNHGFLRDLNGLVLYGNARRGGYRGHDIRVLGSDYLRTHPIRIVEELDGVLEEYVRKSTHLPAIELAAGLHFHIVRVHPFSDGNGRTARLVQNLVLDSHGLPPLVIPASERDFYGSLIERALGGYVYERDEDLGPFYTYLASKLALSLGQMLDYHVK